MINFIVNEDKCTNCGRCSADCPVLIINNKTEYPTIKEGKEETCLKCQHCLAVCPEGAISIWGKEPENSIPANSQIPHTTHMANLYQTRRSIRKFKKEEVDQSTIENLIAIASYAPTAKNENAVQFTVVENRDEMAKLRDLTYNRIKAAFNEDRLAQPNLYMNKFREVWEAKNIDIIFRNAPHLVIFSAPKTGTEPLLDCSIAASYFELLANSNGLGTMWNGFAKYAFEDVAPEIKSKIGIPENHKVGTVLLFGHSAVKFARSIQNDNPNIKPVRL